MKIYIVLDESYCTNIDVRGDDDSHYYDNTVRSSDIFNAIKRIYLDKEKCKKDLKYLEKYVEIEIIE